MNGLERGCFCPVFSTARPVRLSRLSSVFCSHSSLSRFWCHTAALAASLASQWTSFGPLVLLQIALASRFAVLLKRASSSSCDWFCSRPARVLLPSCSTPLLFWTVSAAQDSFFFLASSFPWLTLITSLFPSHEASRLFSRLVTVDD